MNAKTIKIVIAVVLLAAAAFLIIRAVSKSGSGASQPVEGPVIAEPQ